MSFGSSCAWSMELARREYCRIMRRRGTIGRTSSSIRLMMSTIYRELCSLISNRESSTPFRQACLLIYTTQRTSMWPSMVEELEMFGVKVSKI